ncbi:unnamed protein product [Discula destructiva]
MPPRLPLPSSSSVELCSLASCGSSIPPHHITSPLELALRACQASSSRPFSTTPHRNSTLPAARYKFYQWLKTQGAQLATHKPGVKNYLRGRTPAGDKLNPFPSNEAFVSEPVLSEEARELIHKRVSIDDEPIMVVSADLNVDHRRVAAVVRMKEVEKDWERMGKKLAKPYSRAVMEMLPVHHFGSARDGEPTQPFEPINEIHVHGHTMQQLFVPTSESRHFTREDAAKVFNERMLSADARIPHKELVKHHRRVHEGESEKSSRHKFIDGARAAERGDVIRDASKTEWEKRLTLAVPTERAEFRFKKMTVDDGGFDGRSRRGVGWRYGAPYEDRKKDQVKHPIKYE